MGFGCFFCTGATIGLQTITPENFVFFGSLVLSRRLDTFFTAPDGTGREITFQKYVHPKF